MARFIVKGINDDKSFCECCGKSGLQRVVWIEDTETGEIKHFGTSCAMKPAKGFDCSEDIKSAIKTANELEKRIVSEAGRRYRKVYNGARVSGVDEKGPFTKYTDDTLWARAAKLKQERSMSNERYWTYQAAYTPSFNELPAGCFNGTENSWHSLSPGMRREIVRSHNRPLAAPGLTSYRYKQAFGYIMIGARDIPDALSEANRSLTVGKARVDFLQVWNGSAYVNVI